MGFKNKIKTSLRDGLDLLQKLASMLTQSSAASSAQYQSILQHLDDIDQQTRISISRITEEIERMNAKMSQGTDSKNDFAPAVLSLSEELRTRQEDLVQQLSSVRESLANASRKEVASPDLSNQLSKISTSVTRHNMVIEDLIESMEESQKAQKSTLEEMRKIASQQDKAEITELRSNENSLLTLIELYQDQLHLLELAAQSDPAWNHQFELVRQKLASQLQSAGVSIIEKTHVPVNYDLHEVIERVSTDQAELNLCIAEVYKCGYIYRGKVRRKAQVSAYSATVSDPAVPEYTDGENPSPDTIIYLGSAQPSVGSAVGPAFNTSVPSDPASFEVPDTRTDHPFSSWNAESGPADPSGSKQVRGNTFDEAGMPSDLPEDASPAESEAGAEESCCEPTAPTFTAEIHDPDCSPSAPEKFETV